MDQGPAGDFCRVSCEHQLDAKLRYGLADCRGIVAPGLQLGHDLSQRSRGGHHRVHFPRNGVVLVGDIGQVEKLAECPGNGHQFVFIEFAQQFQQLFPRRPVAVPGRARKLADVLDLFEKRRTLGSSHGVPEHAAKEADIAPQRRIVRGL